VSTTVEELLRRHVQAGTVPGALALLGSDDAPVVAAGVAAVGGGPMREDAIMRIQSMTKPITSVAALRLVEAGRLGLDQGLEEWLPELADRRVLSSPTAELGDTVPAHRSITLRHLLTNASGYGMALVDSPLQQAMADNGTEAGPQPLTLGAQEWLARLTELPLAFQPGEGWRYHHSFGLLGILITRLTDRSLGQHLAEDLFGPLGMTDTALWVPEEKLDRLPAAYRHGDDGLVETEPAGGGFYAGPASFDVSHGELVSTARDFHRFARMLAAGGRGDGEPMISADHLQQMTSDQVARREQDAGELLPWLLGEDGLGVWRRGADRGTTARPLWLVGRSGDRLLRRSGRDGRDPPHPGRVGSTDVDHDRGVPGAALTVPLNRRLTTTSTP
jgi:CubicO group peptidase (beta-lactamase class C family)